MYNIDKKENRSRELRNEKLSYHLFSKLRTARYSKQNLASPTQVAQYQQRHVSITYLILPNDQLHPKPQTSLFRYYE